jgi:hypothetical protein
MANAAGFGLPDCVEEISDVDVSEQELQVRLQTAQGQSQAIVQHLRLVVAIMVELWTPRLRHLLYSECRLAHGGLNLPGRGFVVIRVVDGPLDLGRGLGGGLLELAQPLAERPHDLRNLPGAKEQQDDQQNADYFWKTE